MTPDFSARKRGLPTMPTSDRMKNWRTVGEWHEGYTQAELFNLKRI